MESVGKILEIGGSPEFGVELGRIGSPVSLSVSPLSFTFEGYGDLHDMARPIGRNLRYWH